MTLLWQNRYITISSVNISQTIGYKVRNSGIHSAKYALKNLSTLKQRQVKRICCSMYISGLKKNLILLINAFYSESNHATTYIAMKSPSCSHICPTDHSAVV